MGRSPFFGREQEIASLFNLLFFVHPFKHRSLECAATRLGSRTKSRDLGAARIPRLTGAMGKRAVYTKVTPLPSNIPRQLALDMLHSHAEVIQLNPLVTGVRSISAPRDAAADEFFSQWYDISEVLNTGFGMKKKVSFKGVFHDQPWGLQSHVYAPMGVDLRNKYRIGGNQPGEPREVRELGIETPLDGLYLREDVEIICNVPLTIGFVKKEMKAATGIMIARLVKKAELLDDGTLHAMFQDGMLKTSKPSAQPTFGERASPNLQGSPSSPPVPDVSPTLRTGSFTPAVDDKGYGRYSDIASRTPSQRQSVYTPHYQHSGYNGHPAHATSGADMADIYEVPGSYYHNESPGLYPPPLKPQGQVFRAELPGDSMMSPNLIPSVTQPAQQHQTYEHPAQNLQPPYPNHSPLPSPPLGQNPQPSPGLGHSPQPSPRLTNRQRSESRSSYKIANPEQHNPMERHSSHGSNVEQWQRGLAIAPHQDPNSIRNSRHSSQFDVPDHERFSQMSMQQQQQQQPLPLDVGRRPRSVSKCPVCGLFEGDEAAVTHHVSKAHFA